VFYLARLDCCFCCNGLHKTDDRSIPKGWALDKNGKSTTDPAAALDGGVMLPMGGPKGSGLAVMMDVFSGVFSGSAFAGDVVGPYEKENMKESNVGHFLVAIKPDLFMSLDEFRERMTHLYKKVVESEKMDGVERIYFPGEIEQLVQEEREKTGIPFVEAEVDTLNAEAEMVRSQKFQVQQVT
jgi:LDH2 family malate/lactate/ureidoglycolate dehydrogenase